MFIIKVKTANPWFVYIYVKQCFPFEYKNIFISMKPQYNITTTKSVNFQVNLIVYININTILKD